MATPLRAALDALTHDFVASILRAVQVATLTELGTGRPPHAKAPTKRIRRSPAQIEAVANHMVAILKRHPNGMRAEDLKRAVGVKPGNRGAKVFTKPLSIAIATKRVTKRGHRRATTYHAV